MSCKTCKHWDRDTAMSIGPMSKAAGYVPQVHASRRAVCTLAIDMITTGPASLVALKMRGSDGEDCSAWEEYQGEIDAAIRKVRSGEGE
jgi:hypothetical protein